MESKQNTKTSKTYQFQHEKSTQTTAVIRGAGLAKTADPGLLPVTTPVKPGGATRGLDRQRGQKLTPVGPPRRIVRPMSYLITLRRNLKILLTIPSNSHT